MAREHRRPSGLGRVEPGRRSLTASEAAAIIGVSVATVRGWADQGRLPSHRTVGGHRRFDMDELRDWLDDHGAPIPRRFSLNAARTEIPACPDLARELNARSDAIIERVLSGYDDSVPTITQIPSDTELRRAATRFVRVVTGALESGNPSAFAGRAEIAGYRGGLQGERGGGVLVEHTRLALALLQEAQDAIDGGTVNDEHAMACLLAVIDGAQAAVARGYGIASQETI